MRPRHRALGLVTTTISIAASAAVAQGTLVIDLLPGAGPSGNGYVGYEGIALGDRMLFAATSAAAPGDKLWISDGTAAGTQLVLDTYPGGAAQPHMLTRFGSVALFVASDATGSGLWRTDGTSAGTSKLSASVAGLPAVFDAITPAGAVAYFRVQLFGGNALWRTDGTPAGTAAVASIPPLGLGSGATTPVLVAFQQHVYFRPSNATGELWRSDGTALGTGPFATLGPPETLPDRFTVAGDLLYFAATSPASGRELWKTDGTPAGTGPVVDLAAGAASSSPASLVSLDDGRLLFAVHSSLFSVLANGLWVTDGTPAGTLELLSGVTVVDVVPCGQGAFVFGESKLWRTDGSAAGTQLVADAVYYTGTSPLRHGAGVGSGAHAVFPAAGAGGDEPWFTDGAQAAQAFDVQPGAGASIPRTFVHAGAHVFFSAFQSTTGFELHAFDLAAVGAWMAEPFGAGCGGGATAPSLASTGAAIGGGTIVLHTTSAAPLAPAVLLVAASPALIPLGGGCSAYLAEPAVLLAHATSATGASAVALAIPSSPGVVGAVAYFQDLVVAPGGPLLGLAELTNGLECVIGP